MVTIKVSQNGPYLVEGDDVRLIDWNGNEYQVPNRRSFALCRCGGSRRKPLCDGTHSRTGFNAAEAAVPGSVDRPALQREATEESDDSSCCKQRVNSDTFKS